MDKIVFTDTIWPLCLPKVASEDADEFAGDALRVISYGPKDTSQASNRAGRFF